MARAKLYRFDENDKEWKERGIGEVKLLKHTITGKAKLLMRREKTFRICANHLLHPSMELITLPSPQIKAFRWMVSEDFTEEIPRKEHFLIRYKITADAIAFKKHFDELKQSVLSTDSRLEPEKTIPIKVVEPSIQPLKTEASTDLLIKGNSDDTMKQSGVMFGTPSTFASPFSKDIDWKPTSAITFGSVSSIPKLGFDFKPISEKQKNTTEEEQKNTTKEEQKKTTEEEQINTTEEEQKKTTEEEQKNTTEEEQKKTTEESQ